MPHLLKARAMVSGGASRFSTVNPQSSQLSFQTGITSRKNGDLVPPFTMMPTCKTSRELCRRSADTSPYSWPEAGVRWTLMSIGSVGFGS